MQRSMLVPLFIFLSWHGILADVQKKQTADVEQAAAGDSNGVSSDEMEGKSSGYKDAAQNDARSDVACSPEAADRSVLTDDMFDQMPDKLAEPRRWPAPIEVLIARIKRPALAVILWVHGVKCWLVAKYYYFAGHEQEKDET